MVGFCIGGPAEELERAEEIYRNFLGLIRIEKKTDNIWILCFENKESAIAAQWQIEALGGKGVK